MKKVAIGLCASLVLALTTGCIGQMALSAKVKRWNLEVVEGRWAREAVFLALYFIPVYPFAATGDLLVVNSIEFHTGTNPLSGKPRIARVGETHRIETEDGWVAESALRGDGSIDLRITDDAGTSHFINLARRGDRAIARDTEGRTLASLRDGRVVKLVSESTPPGR